MLNLFNTEDVTGRLDSQLIRLLKKLFDSIDVSFLNFFSQSSFEDNDIK